MILLIHHHPASVLPRHPSKQNQKVRSIALVLVRNNEKEEMGSTAEYWAGETIGEGSFGTVVFGLHKSTHLKVAFKCIDKSSMRKNMQVAQAVLDEQKILKRLKNCQSVVDLYASFHDAQCVYLVLEACPWKVSDFVQIPNKVSLARQIVEAIAELHQQNVVHCDITPNNLLVTERGRVKLTDFGSSIVFTAAPTAKTNHRPRGTTAYSAPELLKNDPFSKAVDLWSLGCVLFYLFKGESPFERATDAQTVDAITEYCSGDNPVQSVVTDDFGTWKTLIDGLLQPTPSERLGMKDDKPYQSISNSPSLVSPQDQGRPLPKKELPAWYTDKSDGLQDGAKGWGAFLV